MHHAGDFTLLVVEGSSLDQLWLVRRGQASVYFRVHLLVYLWQFVGIDSHLQADCWTDYADVVGGTAFDLLLGSVVLENFLEKLVTEEILWTARFLRRAAAASIPIKLQDVREVVIDVARVEPLFEHGLLAGAPRVDI